MSEFEQEQEKNTTENNDSENEKFSKIIIDFTKDILNTFPEFADDLDEHLTNIITYTDDEELSSTNYLFQYCKSVYPEKFFDILYQNKELFEKNEPLYLLPNAISLLSNYMTKNRS